MNVNVKKLVFYGLKGDLDEFIIQAQTEGFLEFISPVKKGFELPQSIQELVFAIKILKKLPVKGPLNPEAFFDPKIIAQKVVQVHTALEEHYAKQKQLEEEKSKNSFFGDFSLADVEYLTKESRRFLQYFAQQSTSKNKTVVPEELIFLGTDYDLDYYIAIQKKKKSYPKMIEIEITRPIKAILHHLQVVQEHILTLDLELKGYLDYLPVLQKELLEELNAYNKEDAKKKIQMPLDNSLFAVEAYLPVSKEKALAEMLHDLSIEYAEVQPGKGEKIPTCLENEGLSRIGEDLVEIYDTPSVKDKDPSLWVLFFFTIFYGMMIADLGYGIIYLLFGLFLHVKMKKKSALAERMKRLIMLLGIGCSFFGLASGSFFGKDVPPTSPLSGYVLYNNIAIKKADYHLQKKDNVYREWVKKYPKVQEATDGKDFVIIAAQGQNFDAMNEFKMNVLMELALLVGAIHIILSLIRDSKRNWANIGWVLFIIGGYLYFPLYLQAHSILIYGKLVSPWVGQTLGLPILYFGIGLSVVLALIQYRMQGLNEITKVLQVFADVLSYLRLYALALAGMILTATLYDMAKPLPFIAGVLVIIIGQIVNFVISIMGGVIHGLRLNFIEWYHYSYEGDGKLFNPLKLLK